MKSVFFPLLMLFCTIAQAKQVPLDPSASQITWKGEKKLPGAGDHTGSVQIKKGSINLNENNELIGGSIVIDMTSIQNQDLSGKYKTKLESHLNSEDFFHVKKHPEATFKITKVEKTRSDLYKVTGNLTLRGETHTETFEVQVGSKREKRKKFMTASGDININRVKYGVTYNSETGLMKKAVKVAKDKIIKDNIELTLSLQSQAL